MQADLEYRTERAFWWLAWPVLLVFAVLCAAPAAAQSSAPVQAVNGTLQLQDFMRLLLTQLTAQDPLSPQNPQDFLVQIAQMTNLQQTQQISGNTGQMLATSLSSQALTLLGKTVTFAVDSSGSTLSGTVVGIDFSASGPVLAINRSGQVVNGISLSQISSVK